MIRSNLGAAHLRAAALSTAIVALAAASALAGTTPTVFIPAASSVGPVTGTPGTGLPGQIWLPLSTGNLAANLTYAASNTANATFLASSVDYPRDGQNSNVGDPLSSFLGNDAASVVGINPATTPSGPLLIRLAGMLAFSVTGTFTIGVGSDDGFDLRLGDTNVSRFDGDRPFTYTYASINITQPGLYPIDLFYWANNSTFSGLELVWDIDDNAAFDPITVPTANLYIPAPSAAGALALVGLVATRRRR